MTDFDKDVKAETIIKPVTQASAMESSVKKRKPKKLPVAISETEFTSLIKSTSKEHHKIAFLLGYGAGMRISEILKLEPRDVNIKEERIMIRQGKGSKDRVVPLPKGFRERHLKLIPMKCGERALEKAFKKCCEKAGLLKIKPTLHFHSLRHGFATQSIRTGMKIHNLRTLMGHSNISTTNVYLESNPEDALKEYRELF